MKNLIKVLLASATLAAVSAPMALANDPMTESLRSVSGNQFDQAFLKQMIDHHKQGVEMTQLAGQKGQSPAVKNFAEKTGRMQQKDIEELTTLLGAGKSTGASSTTSHETHGTAHMQMKQVIMSKLQSAEGADFERAFADEMLKHHQMAKEMAQLAQKKATRDDVKAFAAKTVKMQEMEARELKQLASGS